MTLAEFKAALPVFKDEVDALIQAQLTASVPYFDTALWGNYLAEGNAYWVAHMLTINKVDGLTLEANDLTSRDTTGIHITRDADMVKGQSKDHFMRTVWGQRYRHLSRRVGMGPLGI